MKNSEEKKPLTTKISVLSNETNKNEISKKPLPKKPETKRSIGPLITELIFSVLLVAAICALHTVNFYANNVGSVSFADVGQSMWIYIGISVGIFAILRIFLRKPYFACLFVAIGAFLAVNFDWLIGLMRLFINEYVYAAIGGLVLYLIIVAGFFFLLRFLYKKDFPASVITRILSVTFTVLVLFNVVMAFIAMGSSTPAVTQVAAASAIAPVTTPDTTPSPTVKASDSQTAVTATPQAFGKPNVYFFIMDEYGTFDIVSKYYKYDNKDFYDFLTNKGFNISKVSYATDNETLHCSADLMNLNYISRHLSDNDCLKNITGAPFFKAFTDLGYSESQISTNNDFFNGVTSLNPDISLKTDEALSMDGQDADAIVSDDSISNAFTTLLNDPNNNYDDVDKSALNKWGYYPSDYIRNSKAYKDSNQEYKQENLRDYADALLSVFDYFDNTSNYSNTAPHVTFAYMMCPHVPFIFNEYGGLIPSSQSSNWENPNIYLNQYKFVTKHMMAAITAIIDKDPNSIIIVMSDHGIRYHADCKLKHTFYITDKDSCRIMNAVYVKGQSYNIEGLSGVNTLRYILGLYGLDYPAIQDPITPDSPDSLKGVIPKPR